MQALVERAYFSFCQALGWLLASVRYSKTQVVELGDGPQVRKRRLFYASLLVWLSDPLVRILDAGVRVLPLNAWIERERLLYRSLYGASVAIDADGTIVLPYLRGRTLASLLEDADLANSDRERAIECAVVALTELHRRGFTHADAMARNVLVDLPAGVAHWFDFETVHDSSRSMTWRRSDDVRALLVTCLARTAPERRAEILKLVLDVYHEADVTLVLATNFSSVMRRSLTYQLSQARLTRTWFREIGRLLSERQ